MSYFVFIFGILTWIISDDTDLVDLLFLNILNDIHLAIKNNGKDRASIFSCPSILLHHVHHCLNFCMGHPPAHTHKHPW